jgi:hypothetical protein
MKKVSLVSYLLLIAPCFVFAQNVGIGTPTPTKGKLEIVGVAGSGNTNAILGSNANGISFQQNWPTIGFNQYRDNTVGNGRFMGSGYAAIQYMDPGGGGMYIDMLGSGTANTLTSSGVRALSIQPNGNVGILNNGSTASLTVSRGTGFDGTARFDGTNNSSYINNGTNEDTYIRAGKTGSKVYVNDISNGIVVLGNGTARIGVNKINPLFTLDILQNNDKGILLTNSNDDSWELFNGGPFFFKFNTIAKAFIDWNDGHYAQLSDARVKKNITALPNVLDKIMQLQPVEYDMKVARPATEKSMGFIAQDVRKLFPSMVSIIADSETHGHKGITDLHMMDYSGFGVIAIKGIQEQQQQIDDLKKINEQLAKEITELKMLITSKK